MSAPLRLALFDVDGTLVDSLGMIVSAMDQAFEALALTPPPREDVAAIIGLSLEHVFLRLAPEQPAETQTRLAEAYRNAFVRIDTKETSLYPGARAALDRLSQIDTLFLGVATGKSRRGLDRMLTAHGLTGRFVTEQVSDHHPSKPHPAMVTTALAECGVAAAHAVMIGDTVFDIEMGRAAGVRTLGVAWGYHPVSSLRAAGADLIIETWDDVDAALDALWEHV